MTTRATHEVGGITIDGPAAEQVALVVSAALRYHAADTEARAESASEALLDAVERLLDLRRSQAKATAGFVGPRRSAGRPPASGSEGGSYEGLRGEIADALKGSR